MTFCDYWPSKDKILHISESERQRVDRLLCLFWSVKDTIQSLFSSPLLKMEFGVRLVVQEDPIIPLLSGRMMVM